MEKLENDKAMTFDTMFTNSQIQMLKVMLPFCSPQSRRMMAIMIKVMELQHTLHFIRSQPDCMETQALPFSFADVCSKIKDFCPPQQRSMLEQFESLQSTMQMYEEMKQYMDLFQGMGDAAQDSTAQGASDTDGTGPQTAGSPFNPMDMLSGLLSPEQQTILESFQSQFSTQAASMSDSESEDAATGKENENGHNQSEKT